MKVTQLIILLVMNFLLVSCADEPETVVPEILTSLNPLHDEIKTFIF